ncbi:MAG: DNA polymerase [Aureliella sp.]
MDDGEIHLIELWRRTIRDNMRLLEAIADRDLVGFNLTFDTFQICKWYTMLDALLKSGMAKAGDCPEDRVSELDAIERDAMNGPCWKPRAACDLMLWSRKNKYQTLMNRGDIRIRKVPTPLAYVLADELDNRIEIPDIYFARYADAKERWRVYDIDGDIHFKDVVLKFNPAAGLKYLAEHVLGEKPPFHFTDIACDSRPHEVPYAPTAWHARQYYSAEAKEGDVIRTWPDLVRQHIRHWANCEPARCYATLDIEYTRKLWHAFDCPEPGDDDSELACMVAAVRWHGFEVDLDGIRELRRKSKAVVNNAPVNVNRHVEVREYLEEVMDESEKLVIMDSTRKQILEEIAKTWKDDNAQAAYRAQRILDVKYAAKEVELYDKVLLAGKLHAELNVIGAVSSRMSGGGGLNVQGIKHSKEVRSKFIMAWDGMILSGGDFSSYEVTLADAVYNDPDLRKLLLSGKKIHGLFGTALFPGTTYEEILASEGTSNDMYSKSKSGVFALIYGGNAMTLHLNLGIPRDVAEQAVIAWHKMFPGIGRAIKRITEQFSAIVDNPSGRGFMWKQPDDYVTTKLDFRRYFSLEYMVCRALYDLATSPPKEWRNEKIKVVRRERVQTAGGAVQSALFGASFAIQNANIRAACNHEIQSLGATICKSMQRKIWDIQPHGVNPFVVAPLNVHDEVLSVTHPDYVDRVGEVVAKAVGSYRPLVPLIGIKWQTHMQNWAEKKEGVGRQIKVAPDVDAMLALAEQELTDSEDFDYELENVE